MHASVALASLGALPHAVLSPSMTARLRNGSNITYHEADAMPGSVRGKGRHPSMSTVVVKRPTRRPAPEIPTGELAVDPPPEIPQAAGGRWQQAAMALPMLGGSGAMALMMGRGTGGAFSYVVGGLFGV